MPLFRRKRKYQYLLSQKLQLIEYAFSNYGLQSFADLGGVWRVEGGYTFDTLEKYKVRKAFIVDTHPTQTVIDMAKDFPQLSLVKGNFGDETVAQKVGQVDAVLLFDVLLHQVDPDWDRILEMYAPRTRTFIIYNQQWIGPGRNVRLLDLGEEEYFNNAPADRLQEPYINLYNKLDQKHPDHNKKWKDVHHIWQWGITDMDLIEKLDSIGFRLEYKCRGGTTVDLPNFRDHMFIFMKK